MEDLIQNVAEKTGLTPDQARSAITVVVDHLKDKLPWGLGDKIESFLASGSQTAADGDASASGAGMFDELKDKLSGGLSSMFS